MDFSVVIPSRNRPALLRQAIESVLQQTHEAVEIRVVNDGSDADNEAQYRQMAFEWPDKVHIIHLPQTHNGHGPSYAINRGVEHTQGKYVCFLDDDDFWTDPEHLQRAWQSLNSDTESGDIYFSNQCAVQNGQTKKGERWLAGLEQHARTNLTPDSQGTYRVAISDLMHACNGKFAHLNTIIVAKECYLAVQGMDEGIRYECEWDLYLRLLVAASTILYNPAVISQHNVPDPTRTVNVSTGLPLLQKLLSRVYVLDKALLFSPSDEIRAMAERHKVYSLKRMAELLAQEKKFKQAYHYARQARIKPWQLKWNIYSCYLGMRALISGN